MLASSKSLISSCVQCSTFNPSDKSCRIIQPYLGSHHKAHTWNEIHPPLVECFDNIHHACAVRPMPGVGEDGDEDMLFDIEWPRVERESPLSSRDPHRPPWQHPGHQMSQRKGNNLNGNGRDMQRLRTVCEECVHYGDEDVGQDTQDEGSEREAWKGWVIRCPHRQLHLLNLRWRVITIWWGWWWWWCLALLPHPWQAVRFINMTIILHTFWHWEELRDCRSWLLNGEPSRLQADSGKKTMKKNLDLLWNLVSNPAQPSNAATHSIWFLQSWNRNVQVM